MSLRRPRATSMRAFDKPESQWQIAGDGPFSEGNRECGQSVTLQAAAAPATVSGEPSSMATGSDRSGKANDTALNRKPGDLPSSFDRFAPGGVSRAKLAAALRCPSRFAPVASPQNRCAERK